MSETPPVVESTQPVPASGGVPGTSARVSWRHPIARVFRTPAWELMARSSNRGGRVDVVEILRERQACIAAAGRRLEHARAAVAKADARVRRAAIILQRLQRTAGPGVEAGRLRSPAK